MNFEGVKVVGGREAAGKVRRRTKTLAVGDVTVSGRRDRLAKRNRTMVARYYYWTEIRRRRFDDVLKILSDYEFFVDERTINNALLEHDSLYKELVTGGFGGRKLEEMFPGWRWE